MLAGVVARLRGLTLESFEREMQETGNRHLIPFPSRNRITTNLEFARKPLLS